MHRRLLSLLTAALLLLVVGVAQQQGEGEPGVLRNPLNFDNGADPWLTYYDGNYYLAATTWTSEWVMRKSPTLAGLKTADPVTIYTETEPERCCNFWAPEFHRFDGHWYFYYTAGSPLGNYGNQHSYVLESAGTDPLGPYTFKGRLYDPTNDAWSIDGSVLDLDGALYWLFSGSQDGKQSLFIAQMSNPWTVSGARVLISEPEYDWETQGGRVNEGPVALQHEGDTFIVYSASACHTPDYKLGMLTLTGSNPLDPASWSKSPEPVFQRSDANGVYAPGHNGFFKSPDGTEDWIVYHANDSADYGCNGQRSTRVQKIEWNADGTPNFGVPLSTQTEIAAPSGDTGVDPLPRFPAPEIVRFESFGLREGYLRHTGFVARIDVGVEPIGDSQFRLVPGLADPAAVSIESVNFPGFYVRQSSNVIYVNPDDHSTTFATDATWWQRPGLADAAWASFESFAMPGNYIGKKFGVIALTTDLTTPRSVEDATFRLERGTN